MYQYSTVLYTLYHNIYTVYTHYTYTPYTRTIHILRIHALYIYSVYTHYTYTPYTRTIHIHRIHALYIYTVYTHYTYTPQSYELKLATLGISSDLELSRVRAWLDRMQRLKKYRIDRIAYIKVRRSVYESDRCMYI